jgi:hypothetical protein
MAERDEEDGDRAKALDVTSVRHGAPAASLPTPEVLMR